jgi:dTDP-4-amino-4,6-dideoxygalactose transaminase
MTIPATLPDASRNASPMLYGPEAEAVARVLGSGQYGHTEVTEHFEREIARFLGVPDAVAVASGTAALHIALLTAGIGPGDEVIVPSMTFCATVQAITACGASPRFVDVDPATLCVTPGHVLDALTPATRAVVPVLYGGRPVDLSGIHDQLAERGIAVIQDAAHAFGSHTRSGRIGADRQVTTCFSFGPIKNLTCGQGGMIIPRGQEEAEAARTLRMLGVTTSAAERAAATSYTVAGFGLRYQMSAINAAIGTVQLAHFATAETVRKRLWRAYQAALAGLDDVTVVDVDIEHSVPSLCVVRVPHRDRVFAFLRERGIGAGVHYPPNHLQPAFARWHRDLPVTEAVGGQILTLPFHQHLTEEHVRHVAALLGQALAEARP